MPRQAAPRTSSPRGLARAVELPGTGARLHEHRLRNGLRVLLVERHADPVVTSLLWYDAGARDEAPHEAGVAHFLEHMMFKGTRRHGKGQVDAITTQLGGSNNAFTSYDHTAYWFELSSDRWETALELEADRMRGLRLDEAEFRSEKAVVLEELAMGLDEPWRRLTDLTPPPVVWRQQRWAAAQRSRVCVLCGCRARRPQPHADAARS